MGYTDLFKSIVDVFNALLPKTSISKEYSEMFRISFELAQAQLDDEITYKETHKIPIPSEWVLKRFHELLYDSHLKNQIELFNSKSIR